MSKPTPTTDAEALPIKVASDVTHAAWLSLCDGPRIGPHPSIFCKPGSNCQLFSVVYDDRTHATGWRGYASRETRHFGLALQWCLNARAGVFADDAEWMGWGDWSRADGIARPAGTYR